MPLGLNGGCVDPNKIVCEAVRASCVRELGVVVEHRLRQVPDEVRGDKPTALHKDWMNVLQQDSTFACLYKQVSKG